MSKADTQVKERPILFSSAMVKAILEGRKTQRRRVAKFVPYSGGINLQASSLSIGDYCTGNPEHGKVLYSMGGGCWQQRTKPLHCPYGRLGDKLWVRETLHKRDGWPWEYRADNCPVEVSEDSKTDMLVWAHHKETDVCVSIHMPRWASRITLEVTKVRVERVQDISAKDVEAEGVIRYRRYPGQEGGFPDGWEDSRPGYGGSVWVPSAFKDAYRVLWDSINAKRGFGWDKNPFVWCIDFKKL